MSLDDFREEARQWIADNAPASLYGTRTGRFDGYWGGKKHPELPDDVKRWLHVSLDKGWTAPDWPVEYGGGGLNKQQAEVINNLLVEMQLPPPLVGFGLAMIGPTLLDYGNAEQKALHVPRIVRGEIRWCQGYSEPGAGSDLASLSTRAERDGDDFVLNGQKVWTSHADQSDWIFALVRTNANLPRKQQGITFILVDMDTPGVSARPIELISGASPFCETFFENARVPAANVVGDVDDGWRIGKALLGYERSMIGSAIGGQLQAARSELVQLARLATDTEEGPLPDDVIRDDLAAWSMDERCFAATIHRVVQSMKSGQAPGSESSILKVAGSDLKQRRWELGMRLLGPQSAGWEGDAWTDTERQMTRDWLRSRGNSIEGGTSEVQLNIMAKHVLGLK